MALIERGHLEEIDRQNFGPHQIQENLSAVEELFPFLRRQGDYLKRSRPVVVFISAIAVHAFYQAGGGPQRQPPPGLFDALWEKFAYQGLGREAAELVSRLEPDTWQFFGEIVQAALVKENWSQKELAMSGLVFSTVLTALIYIFWPEESLKEMEDHMHRLGLSYMPL